jgi:uncharacterized BrkB/YihY/UPF0761 family membrane protein
MVWVRIDHDVVAIPKPVVAVGVVGRGNAEEEAVKAEPGFAWLVRIGVPLAAILIPLGFFLSVSFTPDRPNKWIWSLYAGALVLAVSVVVLGIGLIRA